jgi:subtilisin family serine protease
MLEMAGAQSFRTSAILVPLLLLTLDARAERVRVVVAVGQSPVSIESVSPATPLATRAQVMSDLATASSVSAWGESAVFSAEIDVEELETLRQDPRVRAVSIDRGGGGALAESVPLVGASAAHVQGITGRGIIIAILDTGVDARHPDLSGRVVAEQCFCDNPGGSGCCPNGDRSQSGANAAQDDNGHGTHVAGIAAGAGFSASRGIAPEAHIVAVKVMDGANRFASFLQIYQGLEWIATQQPFVSVINMSLGSDALFAECGEQAIAIGLRDVIDRLRARGVVITVSSGNQSAAEGIALPACMNEVIAVGATHDVARIASAPVRFGCVDQAGPVDQIACFSNSSSALDLLAPGVGIISSKLGGGVVSFAGTSMAAPHVAGTVALMQQKGGVMPPAQIQSILSLSGVPLRDPRNGVTVSRVDAAAAVAATPRAPVPPRRRSARSTAP